MPQPNAREHAPREELELPEHASKRSRRDLARAAFLLVSLRAFVPEVKSPDAEYAKPIAAGSITC